MLERFHDLVTEFDEPPEVADYWIGVPEQHPPASDAPATATTNQPVLGTPRAQANRALKIAQERYASGEITREEFLQIKADLES